IWRLREKIEENPKEPKIIETVWGVGYKIEE
ncbi:response regulator transcription factor, partial [Clostridium botulinum]|nr:response regulator transcription factor [Clostridium botulinum]